MSDTTTLGIYIHIPFCKTRCGYCAFYAGEYSDDTHKNYLELLTHEINETLQKHIQNHYVNTIYFGGGTPSSVKVEYIAKLLKSIIETNDLEPDEVSMEVNPSDITEDFIRTIRASGVNRISLGVQSFNDDVLAFLGRRHNSRTAIDSFNLLRERGFNNISLDLMHGYPGFPYEHWESDVSQAIRLNPDHLSIYSLNVEEHTPFYDKRIHHDIDPDQAAEQYHYAIDSFHESGYDRYEISNLAKAKMECAHNLNYWNMGDYLGFGPTAASHIAGNYSKRVDSLEKYLLCLGKGESTVAEEKQFSNHDQFINALIMGLRLEEGISIKNMIRRFGIDPLEYLKMLLGDIFDGFILMHTGDRIYFGYDGFYVSNVILSLIV